MLILLPVILLLLTALTLLILRLARPDFRFNWLIAAGGAFLAWMSVFLWQIRLPQTLSLPPWQPQTLFTYSPVWLADDLSWLYTLSLTMLALAVIMTSVVRGVVNPMAWAGTHILVALGVLAVTADNPLTLVLSWAAIDLVELVSMLRSVEGERQSENAVITFAARLAGIGLVLWASVLSVASGVKMDFRTVPAHAGIYLLLAAGLRLGVLPLHLPYHQEAPLRRGFGTTLRLVSAASSLALLARIPAVAVSTPLRPYLLILTALAALYAGWMWLRASDELTGRPFWLLGMASLAIAATLRADSSGSAAWGSALILTGGFLFLYSARHQYLFLLILTGIWGISALPFSPTAQGWQSNIPISFVFLLPFLLSQSLLIAGYIRHAYHAGDSALKAHPNMSQAIYISGLVLIMLVQTLLGLWGWSGARSLGLWWAGLAAILLSPGLAWAVARLLPRIASMPVKIGRWGELLRLNWLYRGLWAIYRFLGRASNVVTSTLEGEGGVLWSLLLLVLFLSLLTQVVR